MLSPPYTNDAQPPLATAAQEPRPFTSQELIIAPKLRRPHDRRVSPRLSVTLRHHCHFPALHTGETISTTKRTTPGVEDAGAVGHHGIAFRDQDIRDEPRVVGQPDAMASTTTVPGGAACLSARVSSQLTSWCRPTGGGFVSKLPSRSS